MFEQLESRRMMSVSPVGGLKTPPYVPPAPLVVNGTNGNDEIFVTQQGNNIVVEKNGVVSLHAKQYVSKVYVNGLAGADTIDCGDPALTKSVVIKGGAGHDTIWGSYNNDTIYGGVNSVLPADESDGDSIFGLGGDDILEASFYGAYSALYGGTGDDLITSHYGNDALTGEAGDDTIFGNSGVDVIWGGADDDEIHGGFGNDYIQGDEGDDEIWGDDGEDYLGGGEGEDELHGGDDDDELDGGEDDDVLHGNGGDDDLDGGPGDDDNNQ